MATRNQDLSSFLRVRMNSSSTRAFVTKRFHVTCSHHEALRRHVHSSQSASTSRAFVTNRFHVTCIRHETFPSHAHSSRSASTSRAFVMKRFHVTRIRNEALQFLMKHFKRYLLKTTLLEHHQSSHSNKFVFLFSRWFTDRW